jgi:hypothetical protein
LFVLAILSVSILFHLFFLFNFGFHSFNCFFSLFLLFVLLSPSLFSFISFYTRFSPRCFDYYLFLLKKIMVKNFVQDFFFYLLYDHLGLITRVVDFKY